MVNKKSTSSKIMEEDPMPETEISKDFIVLTEEDNHKGDV